MENSIFIAKILGPVLTVVGLGLLFNRKFYQKIIEDLCKNPALLFLSGIMPLVAGLAIVLNNNIWLAGWPVIITIFGWAACLKGLWLLLLPKSICKAAEVYAKNTVLLTVHSIVIITIGAVLVYFSYFI